MSPELSDVLRNHRRSLVERQAPGLAEGWVFPSEAGKPYWQSSLHKPLEKAALATGIARELLDDDGKRTGIEGRIPSAHWFRHTYNNLLRQVATGQVVRAITGHVTEQMTSHYSHVEEHEKAAAAAGVLRLVSAPRSADQNSDQPSRLDAPASKG